LKNEFKKKNHQYVKDRANGQVYRYVELVCLAVTCYGLLILLSRSVWYFI